MIEILKKLTIGSFLLLAAFPLMPENYGAMVIILINVLVLFFLIMEKRKINLSLRFFILTIPFWVFLAFQIIQKQFNLTMVLLYLPFFFIPFVFVNKPKFIGSWIIPYFISVYQFSVGLIGVVAIYGFTGSHNLVDILEVNSYNIPIFREYAHNLPYFDIHPTYIASFFLVSFTFSVWILFFDKSLNPRNLKKRVLLNGLNAVFTSVLIILYASRIVEIGWLLTVIYFFIRVLRNSSLFSFKWVGFLFVLSFFVIGFSFKSVISSRFTELITEINNPVKGNHHNSTNIRMAILHCSADLYKELPFFGYGNSLQDELNECFESSYDSDFYLISTYNTHNFYLHILLFGGWMGLILFLGYLTYLFFLTPIGTLGKLILLQLLLINLTENYLSRHYGIVNFNIMICLFYGYQIWNNNSKLFDDTARRLTSINEK